MTDETIDKAAQAAWDQWNQVTAGKPGNYKVFKNEIVAWRAIVDAVCSVVCELPTHEHAQSGDRRGEFTERERELLRSLVDGTPEPNAVIHNHLYIDGDEIRSIVTENLKKPLRPTGAGAGAWKNAAVPTATRPARNFWCMECRQRVDMHCRICEACPGQGDCATCCGCETCVKNRKDVT